MDLRFSEELAVPSTFVFEDVSNFSRAEQAAERRAITVKRTHSLSEIGAGAMWDVVVQIRRKPRNFNINLTEYEYPDGYALHIKSSTFTVDTRIDCLSLARERSRLTISTKFQPVNLRGRLLLQSIKLARGRIISRSEKRLKAYARRVEQDYQAKLQGISS